MGKFRTEIIGDATLYCGDAREILPVLQPVECLITDPPYGMDFQSNHRKIKHKAIQNDTNQDLLRWACSIPVLHSAYIFCRWDNLVSIPQPKSLVTWVKNNWSMGDLAHEHGRQTEVAAFYAGPDHFFASKRPSDVIYAQRTGNEHHPTEKPIDLIGQVIKWTSGTIVDPFCGSGSTLVAATKLGRASIGIELNEEYFDIACRRVEKAYSQPSLFAAKQKPLETISMEFGE